MPTSVKTPTLQPSSTALEAAAATAALLASAAASAAGTNVNSDRSVALPSNSAQDHARAAAQIAKQALSSVASTVSSKLDSAPVQTMDKPLHHLGAKHRPVSSLFKRRLSELQSMVARELIVLSPHARQYLFRTESSARATASDQRQIDRESAYHLYRMAKSQSLFEHSEQLLEPNQSVRVFNRVMSDTLVLHVPGIDMSAIAIRQFMRELQHTRDGPDWIPHTGWSQVRFVFSCNFHFYFFN